MQENKADPIITNARQWAAEALRQEHEYRRQEHDYRWVAARAMREGNCLMARRN